MKPDWQQEQPFACKIEDESSRKAKKKLIGRQTSICMYVPCTPPLCVPPMGEVMHTYTWYKKRLDEILGPTKFKNKLRPNLTAELA